MCPLRPAWYDLVRNVKSWLNSEKTVKADLKDGIAQKRLNIKGDNTVIFPNDNTPLHRRNAIRDPVEYYDCERMSHTTY